jgi:acetyl esterase/lipase
MKALQRLSYSAAAGLIVLLAASPLLAQSSAPAPSATAPTTAPATQPEATTKPDLSPVVASGSIVKRDLPYVPDATDQQTLDIYAPAGAKAAPVVIFVHGGEWTKGDKSEVRFKPKFLNEEGLIFVSVNYRLSGKAKHPAQVEDVAAAVRWVRDHVAEYGGDPQKLVLMGHSAGCHLVTLVALDPRPLAKVHLAPADLKGIVSWSGGAFDLVEKVKSGGMYADYIRINFGPDEATWRDASPIAHIGEGKPMPPFLFASAEKGNAASQTISEKMAELIRAARGTAQTAVLPGKTHSAANNDLGTPGDTTGDMLVRFVREVTGPGEKNARP